MVIWMDLSQQGAGGSLNTVMWRNIQNTLGYLPFVQSLLHHSTTGTLPNSLLCLQEPWQPAAISAN